MSALWQNLLRKSTPISPVGRKEGAFGKLRIPAIQNKIAGMRVFFLIGLLLLPLTGISEATLDGASPSDADPAVQDKIDEMFRKNIGEGSLGADTFRVRMTADVSMSYVFNDSPDSFFITYRLEIDEPVRNKADVLKGNAKIAAKVKGFLAKWPSGECTLNINVSEAPYEIVFNRYSEEKAKLNVRFTGTILERWQSDCQFNDQTAAKFTTTGNPEKWIDRALKVTAREFTEFDLPIDRYHKQLHKHDFKLERFILADPPLGSAEIEGQGSVELIPEG